MLQLLHPNDRQWDKSKFPQILYLQTTNSICRIHLLATHDKFMWIVKSATFSTINPTYLSNSNFLRPRIGSIFGNLKSKKDMEDDLGIGIYSLQKMYLTKRLAFDYEIFAFCKQQPETFGACANFMYFFYYHLFLDRLVV